MGVRIIAGEFRGRRLLPPPSQATRPVTDRVKQSVFDIVAPLIADAVVYDCFAGTGSMGLECLSRGAARVTFFESDRGAAERLRANIRALNVEDQSAVVTRDLFRWLSDPHVRGAATLLFLDPPYRFLRDRAADLKALAKNLADRHTVAGAMLVFRHDSADALDLFPFRRSDLRIYGGMAVEFLHVRERLAAGTSQ